MQRLKTFFRIQWVWLAWSMIGILLLITGKKIYDLSASPATPKACDFIFPTATDQTKPTTITMAASTTTLRFEQLGGVINDASCLNKTSVYGVVNITSVEDAQKALHFAQENGLKVTSAGQRHSMGGQSFVKDGLVLDMRNFNQLTLDAEHHILHAQTGATWQQIQELLDRNGLSVKAMQSINIFSVGGSLSVNAHGIAHDPGQVATTVRQMHILTSDGEVKVASPTENPELFRHALGGYGLVGVILDVDLDVVPNELYELKNQYMDYTEFPKFYETQIKNNPDVGLFYGRISVSPTSYLTETAAHVYRKTTSTAAIPALTEDAHTTFERFVINFSKTGSFGRWVRWMLEKYVEPPLHACVSRNQAMSQKEVCLVSRNQEMYDSMGYLKNTLADTDILQEYFIPPEKMPQFIDGLRATVKKNGANLLNVTIRIVHKDTTTALPYAKDDRFAFVLYFNQKLTPQDSQILKQTTSDLIDVAEAAGGTYYLPYQLYYTPQQLRTAYPEVDDFFTQKKKFDPTDLFTNTMFEKYRTRN